VSNGVKMVAWGLLLKNEPWKILLRYKIYSSTLWGDSKWHESSNWLFFNKGVRRNNHSFLTKACLKAFVVIRRNLSLLELQESHNMLS